MSPEILAAVHDAEDEFFISMQAAFAVLGQSIDAAQATRDAKVTTALQNAIDEAVTTSKQVASTTPPIDTIPVVTPLAPTIPVEAFGNLVGQIPLTAVLDFTADVLPANADVQAPATAVEAIAQQVSAVMRQDTNPTNPSLTGSPSTDPNIPTPNKPGKTPVKQNIDEPLASNDVENPPVGTILPPATPGSIDPLGENAGSSSAPVVQNPSTK